MSSPHHILVRGPNWIGDQVMAGPAYRALREAYPAARLTLALPEALESIADRKIWDDVLPLTAEARRFPAGVWKAGRSLPRFDLGITFPASISCAAFLWAARIPARVGFSEGGSDLLLTAGYPWPGRSAGRHKAQLYLDLVVWLTGKHASLPSPPPKLRVREKLVVIAPGASIGLRQWPYFPELMGLLIRRYPDFRRVVVGGAGEQGWHQRLRRWKLDGKIENLVEKTSLSELVDLCSRASVVVANDSGVAHLAATLAGAPTLVLFGPGAADYVRPSGPDVTIARVSGLSCSPCEKAQCQAPYGYQRCLRDLSVEIVEKLVDAKLSESFPESA